MNQHFYDICMFIISQDYNQFVMFYWRKRGFIITNLDRLRGVWKEGIRNFWKFWNLGFEAKPHNIWPVYILDLFDEEKRIFSMFILLVHD